MQHLSLSDAQGGWGGFICKTCFEHTKGGYPVAKVIPKLSRGRSEAPGRGELAAAPLLLVEPSECSRHLHCCVMRSCHGPTASLTCHGPHLSRASTTNNLQTAAGTRNLVLDFPAQAFRGWYVLSPTTGMGSAAPPASACTQKVF